MGNRGFTYISLLFLIAVMGITVTAAAGVWSTAARREAEEELLFRGMQIQSAIGMYYEQSPGAKAYPRALEDLLKDNRYPVAKRYLRRLYEDPFTGKPDWEPIKAPDGGIMGVRSVSEAEPMKKKNFPRELAGFEDRGSYRDWGFVYVPSRGGQAT
ncbi:MAG: type II secretion system protein [Deltaproteobacteria bacterium]|nr:type II secretion system protein [Deltaproteobacteria bacterium]